jgi:hypothetical protein
VHRIVAFIFVVYELSQALPIPEGSYDRVMQHANETVSTLGFFANSICFGKV